MTRPSKHLIIAWRVQRWVLVVSILVLLREQQRTNAFQQAGTSPLFSARHVSLSFRRGIRVFESTVAVPCDDDESSARPVVGEVNDQRYSASDWWHNIRSLPRSTVLREIKNPVSAIVAWSALVSILDQLLTTKTNVHLALSSKPHSLLVSSLGLLLVFRTNSAYQRFAVSH